MTTKQSTKAARELRPEQLRKRAETEAERPLWNAERDAIDQEQRKARQQQTFGR